MSPDSARTRAKEKKQEQILMNDQQVATGQSTIAEKARNRLKKTKKAAVGTDENRDINTSSQKSGVAVKRAEAR